MPNPLHVKAPHETKDRGCTVTLAGRSIHLDPLAAAVWQAADGSKSVAELTSLARTVDPAATTTSLFAVCDELADAGLLATRSSPPAGTLQRRHVLMALTAGAFGLALPARAQTAGDLADDVVADDVFDPNDALVDDTQDVDLDAVDQLDALDQPEDELDDDFLDNDPDEPFPTDQLPPLVGLAWDEQSASSWVLDMEQEVLAAEAWAQAPLDGQPEDAAQREQRHKLVSARHTLARRRQQERAQKRQARHQREAHAKQQTAAERQRRREVYVKQQQALLARRGEERAKLDVRQAEQNAKGQTTARQQREERAKLHNRQREASAKQREARRQAALRARQARQRAQEERRKLLAKQRSEYRDLQARRREAANKESQRKAQARKQEQAYKADARTGRDSAVIAKRHEQEIKASDRRMEEALKTK